MLYLTEQFLDQRVGCRFNKLIEWAGFTSKSKPHCLLQQGTSRLYSACPQRSHVPSAEVGI